MTIYLLMSEKMSHFSCSIFGLHFCLLEILQSGLAWFWNTTVWAGYVYFSDSYTNIPWNGGHFSVKKVATECNRQCYLLLGMTDHAHVSVRLLPVFSFRGSFQGPLSKAWKCLTQVACMHGMLSSVRGSVLPDPFNVLPHAPCSFKPLKSAWSWWWNSRSLYCCF